MLVGDSRAKANKRREIQTMRKTESKGNRNFKKIWATHRAK
jgi:hypothetical protein